MFMETAGAKIFSACSCPNLALAADNDRLVPVMVEESATKACSCPCRVLSM